MAGVEFDGENNQASVLYSKWQASEKEPTMVTMLKKWGIVQSKEQANLILVGIAVIAFGLSIYFFFFSGPSAPKINPALQAGAIPAGPGPGGPGAPGAINQPR